MFLHFKIFIKALVCKIIQLIILEMNVFFFLLCLSLIVSKKNVSPMEIQRDFPCALSRKKMGQKCQFAHCLPHENF